MQRCIECFCDSGITGKELQKLVDDKFPDFVCEKEVCSPFSPGPVMDDETLAFILINPLHYDALRKVVVPEAFQEITNRDLSTLRVKFTTKEHAETTKSELIERGKERTPPQSRLVDEVCTAQVGAVRECIFNTKRLMGVYDTALENVESHASIFTNGEALDDRRTRKVVRQKIHELFRNTVPYDEFLQNLN